MEADAAVHEAGATTGPGRARRVMLIAARVSVLRTFSLSLRHRGLCVIARRTRLKVAPGARISFAPGARLFLGFGLPGFTASPCCVQLESAPGPSPGPCYP